MADNQGLTVTGIQAEAELWRGTARVLNPDPLRINYLVVHDDDRLEDMSPLQGFGPSWTRTLWALPLLARLPASLIDRILPLDGLIAMRMGGMNAQAWKPLAIGALEQTDLDDIGFLLVLFAGTEVVSDRVTQWQARQPRATLLIRADPQPVEFEIADTSVRDYCRSVIDAHGDRLSPQRRDAAERGLAGWSTPEPVAIELPELGHNATSPNELVLQRAGRGLVAREEGFIGQSEADYDVAVIASAEAVMAVRDAVRFRDFNRFYLPRPGLILSEPALYRFAYPRMRPESREDRAAHRVLRMFQQQRGLFTEVDETQADALLNDPLAQGVVAARRSELAIYTGGVALFAAQTCSAVLRLRPAVNHVFPLLSRYAANIRARNVEARLKTPRLFDDIQRSLATALGPDRIAFIEQHGGPIKIISDAPLELLPVGDLPLALRCDVSRVNATPGNLMMGELVPRATLTLAPEALSRVLVISAFADDDPLRNLVATAIDAAMPMLEGRVAVRQVRVSSEDELVAALNAADESILVFDGHGTVDDGDRMGGIIVGGRSVSIWNLRERIRVPPIVILSACDTQGIDAPSHVTIGNGFIAVGARTVLATLLPIGGVEAASFLSRFLYRLAAFLPAALDAYERAISWGEFVSGLLRMVLATETIDALLDRAADAEAVRELKTRTNYEINMGRPDWYGALLERIAGLSGKDVAALRRRAARILSRSEAIRYVQLGFPEEIVIDDGTVFGRLFPPDIREQLGIS